MAGVIIADDAALFRLGARTAGQPRRDGRRRRQFVIKPVAAGAARPALLALARRGRRLTFLPGDAFVVVIEHIALAAGDLHASVAIGLVAVTADQRADARRLALDDVERIEAGELDVQLPPA